MNMILENELFTCEHLVNSESVFRELNNFEINPDYPDGANLADYIQCNAFDDEKYGECRTYLVRDKRSDEIVAYFTLRAGLVTRQNILPNEDRHSFDNLSGIDLVCFATNYYFIKNNPEYKGCGIIVFEDFILTIAKNVSEQIGAAIIFGYAVNEDKLMDYYCNKLGFSRLSTDAENIINDRFRERFDKDCYFIYRTIHD